MNEFAERTDFRPAEDRALNQLIRATDECIAEHPWGAVGFALAFGLILGLLGGNRRRAVSNNCRR